MKKYVEAKVEVIELNKTDDVIQTSTPVPEPEPNLYNANVHAGQQSYDIFS